MADETTGEPPPRRSSSSVLPPLPVVASSHSSISPATSPGNMEKAQFTRHSKGVLGYLRRRFRFILRRRVPTGKRNSAEKQASLSPKGKDVAVASQTLGKKIGRQLKNIMGRGGTAKEKQSTGSLDESREKTDPLEATIVLNQETELVSMEAVDRFVPGGLTENTNSFTEMENTVTLGLNKETSRTNMISVEEEGHLNAGNDPVLGNKVISETSIAAAKPPLIGKDKRAHELKLNKGLVGEKKSLLDLPLGYQKILCQNYSFYRHVMGDGSCFYRAFIFGYMEHVWLSSNSVEVSRVITYAQKSLTALRDLGYNLVEIEASFEVFSTFIGLLADHIAIRSEEEFLWTLQNEFLSNRLVLFARWVTASDILKRPDTYKGVISKSLNEFCKSDVIPMKEYADNVQVAALSNSLGVTFGVLSIIASNNSPLTSYYYEVRPEDTKQSEIFFTLLLERQHYEILYQA